MDAEGTLALTGSLPTTDAAHRAIHPWAWWGWAISVGLAASGTTNPLLLALIATALVIVVLLRRGSAPWSRSVRTYLMLAGFVIVMRLFFRIVFGGGHGETVLLVVPAIPLPSWAAGVQVGGPLTAEALAGSLYEALRLAVLLLCVGAANTLANPRRALRSMPAALYGASVAVVVALSVAPQLIESLHRVRRARRLRGETGTGPRAWARAALPVLADAIDRSLALAAGMEARGFGRTRGAAVTGALPLMLGSALLAASGGFLLLSTDFWALGCALLIGGFAGAGVGLRAAGDQLRVTSYQPSPWRVRDALVATAGLVSAGLVLGLGWLDPDALSPALIAALDPGALAPSSNPLVWPRLSPPMLLVVGMVLAPLPLSGAAPGQPVTPARLDDRVRALRTSTGGFPASPRPGPSWR